DVNSGKLPTISWLASPEKFSDHPTSPWYGAWYISEILNILTKNPEVWKKTIFILTYDENDGYFDHAPSYAAADPKRPETGGASAGIDTGLEYIYKEDELAMGVHPEDARTAPIGMGFRVPMIVASPWSRGGWVNSQLFDHTSTLQFLEEFLQQKYGKSVREENISAWRRTVAGDLTSVFRAQDAKEPALDYLNRDKTVIGIAQARYREIPSNYRQLEKAQMEQINHTPRASQDMPHQEPGTRRSCALPYELSADCSLTPDGKQWELRLSAEDKAHGTRSAGAPFNVYLRNPTAPGKEKMRAATYAVKAGDTLTVHYPTELFGDASQIEIYAPNGFYRSMNVSRNAQPLTVHTAYERNPDNTLTGRLLLHLWNGASKPVMAIVSDNVYKAAPLRKRLRPQLEVILPISLEHGQGWYDFTVEVQGEEATARIAGRVETGKPGVSDPAMA
ncbi:MAG TPA: alkaline phosphatase family protein, partial [Acidobacteriaceae bacterium]|nr:alkaline phosphatase family protein [Acidobacteriaceae bacterium]